MRIAIICESYPSKRDPVPSAFIHVRAKAYLDKGHDVLVITKKSPYDGCSEEILDQVDIRRISSASEAKAIAVSWRPGVLCVHAPVMGGMGMSLSRDLDVPVVAWIHGFEALLTTFHGYHNSIIKCLAVLPRDALRLGVLYGFLKNVQAVVYVSDWMRNVTVTNTRLQHMNTYVIPNPVDTSLFEYSQKSPGFPPRGVSVRGLSMRKYGIDIAIRAFSLVRDTDLTIIGDGCLRRKYEALVSRTGSRSTIVPRRYLHSDMPSIYRDFDYFVAPSRTEAQGVAMCEAMSCGLPVVATKAGGIPEFVRDGEDGFLVRQGDYRALARAVDFLVSDSARLQSMGRSARQHILDKCDKDMIIESELAVIESVQ